MQKFVVPPKEPKGQFPAGFFASYQTPLILDPEKTRLENRQELIAEGWLMPWEESRFRCGLAVFVFGDVA